MNPKAGMTLTQFRTLMDHFDRITGATSGQVLGWVADRVEEAKRLKIDTHGKTIQELEIEISRAKEKHE